jgi:hypothetical protein
MRKEKENKPENNESNGKNYNNEKDVDKIFDEFKNKKLGSVVKRARWLTILRNIGISLLVFLVLFHSISFFANNLISRQERQAYLYRYALTNISAPNKYIGRTTRQASLFRIKTELTTYKNIEGKIVYTGEEELDFSFPSLGMITEMCDPIFDYNFDIHYDYPAEYCGYRRYNEFGQRVMIFFYPFLKYENDRYLNDLNLLDDIGSDKYLEMALSFDKEYTLEEVENMLPEDTRVTWYWVDDLNEDEKELLKHPLEERIEMGPSVYFSSVRSEYTAYGMDLCDNYGEEIPDPVEWFIYNIISYKDEFGKGYDFKRIYNNLAGDDGKLTEDDIKILGAVVTGDPESLKPLVGLPFIKASSLGVVTDKY